MDEIALCCHVNPAEQREAIQFFRDLANVGHMLEWDAETVRLDFCKKLEEAGWDAIHIANFQVWAYSTSIWENEIPRKIHEIQGHARNLKSAY